MMRRQPHPHEASVNDRPLRHVRHTGGLSWRVLTLCLALAPCFGAPAPAAAQQAPATVELTLERMVELGLDDSYRVRQLQLGVERRRSLLRAQQADLRSRVYLNIATPEFRAISDEKWNSDLGRNEIVHTNTRLWEMDLSVRQPVMLLGYPTNGYLSLNNRVYRYSQLGNSDEVNYYNRYFVAYEQPLFQPNRMRNSLEEARLNLESAELDYLDDVVRVIDDLADDYYDLFEDAFRIRVAEDRVDALEQVGEIADELAAENAARRIDIDQLEVELANAREQTQQARSGFRRQAEDIKQRLRLQPSDSIVVDPVADVRPVPVDVERAIELAKTLVPRMREIEISRRRGEISLEETEGRNSFRMDLAVSYGREMQDPRFQQLWGEPRNSYTVRLNGYVPVWDWGARANRIQAQEYSIRQTDLRMEEAHSQIETNVRSVIRNLADFEERALNMETNLELARRNTAAALMRYRAGEASLLDVLQTINQEAATTVNFLDAYLGYRNSLLRLQDLTYYDFEHDASLLDRFGIDPSASQR
ncbi:MAG TPA: TolC family protein [Longimicrobiales bacterium]|nr:TolC family protein [Longimicrobiales bacterium]